MNTEVSEKEAFFAKKAFVSYILAVLVFFIHASSFDNYSGYSTSLQSINTYIRYGITGGAVPMFFFLSGYTFFINYNHKRYFSKIKNRFHTLFVPYVLWNSLGMLFAIILSVPLIRQHLIGREPFECSVENIILGIFRYKYNTPFWFIFCLMAYNLMAPALYCLISNKYIGLFSIVAVAVLRFFHIGLPWPLFDDPRSIIFFMTGGYVSIHFSEPFNKRTRMPSIVWWLIVFLCTIVRHFSVMGAIKDSADGLYSIINIVFCIAFWHSFDKISIPHSPFLKHSFWIYALHENVGGVITKLLYFILPKTVPFAYVNFISTICFTLLIIEFLYRLVYRVCPTVHSLLSGGRK